MKVDCLIVDLDAFEEAVNKLGGELVRNASKFTYYGGATEACIHKVRVKGDRQGAHEVGLRFHAADDQERFDTFYDASYASNINTKFGQRLGGLKNEYLATAGEKLMRRKGGRVVREDKAGQILLTVQLPA